MLIDSEKLKEDLIYEDNEVNLATGFGLGGLGNMLQIIDEQTDLSVDHDHWHISPIAPNKDGLYIVTVKEIGATATAIYEKGEWLYGNFTITAWKELPKPFMGLKIRTELKPEEKEELEK